MRTAGCGDSRSFFVLTRTKARVPLESAGDANQATMVFHAQVQRLMREGTPGELVLVNHNDRQGSSEGCVVLRQPLRWEPIARPRACDLSGTCEPLTDRGDSHRKTQTVP